MADNKDIEQKIKISYDTNAKEVGKEVDGLSNSIDDATNSQQKNSAENKKSEENLKSFKTQIREATQDLLKMSATYGATSKEAVTAAKKVAELKDQMGFASDLVDKFNPDQKFKALGAATNLAANALTGVVGGMALFGDQSEETEKALLKVQSAMAFSQAISGLSDMGDQWATLKTVVSQNTMLTKANGVATMVTAGIMKFFGKSVDSGSTSFKGLKMAISATGIGLLVTGLAMVINNFDDIKKVVLKVVPGLSAVGDTIMNIVNAVTDFIGVTSDADRALDRLKANADASLALNKKFIAEHGSQIDEFTKQKIDAKNKYNEALKEDGANQIALGAELNRELAAIEYSRGDKSRKIQADAEKKAEDERKKANEKRIADAKKKAEDELQRQKDLLNEVATKEAAALDEIQDLNDKTEQEKLNRKKERDLEEIELLRQKGADVTNLLIYNNELYNTLQDELDAENRQKELEKNAQKIADRQAFDEEYYTGKREFADAVNEAEIERILEHQLALQQIEQDAVIAKVELDGGTPEEVAQKKQQLNEYYDQKEVETRKKANDAILGQKKAFNDSINSLASQAFSVAKDFAGKNKKAQKAILIAENALGLSTVVINTLKGVSKAMSKGVAGIPEAVIVGASGALTAVKMITSTAKGLKELGGGDAGQAPSIGGVGSGGSEQTAGSATPQVGFQSSTENQIATTLANNTNQTPIVKAYVVSTEMSNAQEVDRNKTESNSF